VKQRRALVVCAFALSGCMLGPDYQRPQTPLPTAYADAPTVSAGTVSTTMGADWWRLYDDPILNDLVATALAENQDVVAAFLAAHPQFRLMPASQVLAQQQIALDTGDYLQLYPHRHGCDGFFAAVLERSNDNSMDGGMTGTRERPTAPGKKTRRAYNERSLTPDAPEPSAAPEAVPSHLPKELPTQ